MTGSIIVARRIFEDSAFKKEPFSEREAWLWMLMDAAWKDHERRVSDTPMTIKRGQLAGSIRFWATAWGWSKSKVHRYLERLEKRDMVRTECGTGVTVITICKYDKFQNGGTAAGQQRDSSGTNQNKGNKGNKGNSNIIHAQNGHGVSASNGYTDAFERWWSVYPRKVGKGAAFRAFERKRKSYGEDVLFSGLEAQLGNINSQQKGPGQDYRPHPATWLNGERFNDPIPQQQKTIYDMVEDKLNE